MSDDPEHDPRGRANLVVGIAAIVLIVIGLVVFWVQKQAQQEQDCEFAGHHNCHPVDTGQ